MDETLWGMGDSMRVCTRIGTPVGSHDCAESAGTMDTGFQQCCSVGRVRANVSMMSNNATLSSVLYSEYARALGVVIFTKPRSLESSFFRYRTHRYAYRDITCTCIIITVVLYQSFHKASALRLQRETLQHELQLPKHEIHDARLKLEPRLSRLCHTAFHHLTSHETCHGPHLQSVQATVPRRQNVKLLHLP